jgi:hypothetical protein
MPVVSETGFSTGRRGFNNYNHSVAMTIFPHRSTKKHGVECDVLETMIRVT